MKRNFSTGTWALAAVLLAATSAHAQTATGAAIYDGVVVDTNARTAYVTGADGRISAIDTTTGTQRWATGAAAKPLAVTESTLVAQAPPREDEQLVIVSIDTVRGGEKLRASVDLPDGLKAHVANSPSQRTNVRAFVGLTGHVVVAWSIESRIARGAAPDDLATQASGAARVDPDTGEVITLPAGTGGDAGLLSNLTADDMMQLRSADGRHVLRSQRSGDPNGRSSYKWTITTASGETVGVVDAPMSVAPFVVAGTQLLHVAPSSGYRDGDRFVQEPLRLRAVDLASGAQLWAVPLLDTASVLPPP